jgi:hypothetical protein
MGMCLCKTREVDAAELSNSAGIRATATGVHLVDAARLAASV